MKYLVITIRDNDYTSEGIELGNFIQTLILNELDEPEELIARLIKGDASYLTHKIAILWSTAHDIWMNFRFGDHQDTKEYFTSNIKIFIADDDLLKGLDDGEYIVIPLSDKQDCHVR
jgi:hypothetical protein